MKIEWNKKNRSLVLVYGIAAVLVLILFAAIPFTKVDSSWVAVIFLLISLGVSCGLTLYAFSSKKELTSKFYGFPIVKMGWIYVLVQTIISLVVIIVSVFVAVPSWIIWVMSVVMLGVILIGSIAADNARDIVEQVESKAKVETKQVKLFVADISGISDRCKDAETRKMIEKLAEKFRFSDPVSSEATEEIEHTITEMINSLRMEVAEGDKDKIQSRVYSIQDSLSERNRICKMSK